MKIINIKAAIGVSFLLAMHPGVCSNPDISPSNTVYANPPVSTYAEETKWYYRMYNGQLQKRLWSDTEKKWLTDWMPA